MLVYICCAGGATSSLFAQKIQEAGGDRIIIEGIFTIMPDLDAYLDTYKLVLAYGPVSILTKEWIQELHLQGKLKAVWIAPQVRFMKNTMSERLGVFGIDVHTIDMTTFGEMNGKKALYDILKALKEQKQHT